MNTMTKIAVFVSGGGTNLQALIDAEKNGALGNGKITLVVSSKPDVYALERAKDNGIASVVLPRKEYDSIASYSRALADTCTDAGIDLIVLAGFLTIFDEQVYEKFPNRILNVHPALIPSFCGKGYYGLHVHEAALEKGVRSPVLLYTLLPPNVMPVPLFCRKRWKCSRTTPPKPCRSGSWNRRNGRFCRKLSDFSVKTELPLPTIRSI